MRYGILTRDAFECAEYLDLVSVDDRLEFNATSLDLRVKRLFRQRALEVIHLSKEYEFDELYVEVEPVNGAWLLEPRSLYVAESVEVLHKGFGFLADVFARSSWARCGVSVHNILDGVRDISNYFEGNLRFSLRTANTSVVLREGDAPAQLRVAKETYCPVANALAIPGIEFVAPGASVNKFGPVLTLDDSILVYKGGVIDPHGDVGRHFERVSIGSDGFEVRKGMFYLASSRERVRVPSRFIGYVHISDHPGNVQFARTPNPGGSHILHGNAPFIDPFPRFEGKVTFENVPFFDSRIFPGMRLTELLLIPLVVPYEGNDASRYKGQSEAQSARNEFKQLKLF